MNVRRIETSEDYRDYLADKGMYAALKSREAVEREFPRGRIIRQHIDQASAEREATKP